MMGGRPLTALDIPAKALQQALGLTDDQTTKIEAIQKKAHAQRGMGGQFGPPQGGPDGQGGPGGQFGPPQGGPGGQGGPGRGPGMNPQAQALIKSIDAILNDKQKKDLPDVLKQFNAYQPAGIPLEIADKVNLTAAQREKVSEIAEAARAADRKVMDEARATGDFEAVREAMQKSREGVHGKVKAVLTDAQNKAIEEFVKSHPRMGPGGPGGGFGGPQGGRGGEFGPPQGGPGGPGGE